jgi:hypothetical protein
MSYEHHAPPSSSSSSQKPNAQHQPQPQHQQQQPQHQQQQQQPSLQSLPYEKQLPRIWRIFVESSRKAMNKAEAIGENRTQENCRELDESVMTFLHTRKQFHRVLGNVEAKLQGKAQEREALEGFIRTQPRLGKRRRLQEQQTAAELECAIQNVANQTEPAMKPPDEPVMLPEL